MAIIVNLDVVLAKRKTKSKDLTVAIGITAANLLICEFSEALPRGSQNLGFCLLLKSGKARAICFSTLDAICKELDCQPADILEYKTYCFLIQNI